MNPLEKAPDLDNLITTLTKEVPRLRESALPTIKPETPGVMTLEEQMEQLSLDTQKNPLKRTVPLKCNLKNKNNPTSKSFPQTLELGDPQHSKIQNFEGPVEVKRSEKMGKFRLQEKLAWCSVNHRVAPEEDAASFRSPTACSTPAP